MQLLSITLAGLLSGSALAAAVPSPACVPGTAGCVPDAARKRTTTPTQVCNADNVLRALRDARYSVSASAFCSTYIQSTVLVTNNATLTGTTTIATVTPVNTQTIDATVTETDTVTTTTTPLTSTFETGTSTPNIQQRQAAASPLPSYVSQYPASRVSSACSCFVTPSSTTTLTVQASTTTTIPATQTLPTTTTSVTSFTTATALATAVVVGPPASCPSIVGCISGYGLQSSFSVPSVDACEAACLSTSGCESFQTGPDYNNGINCNLNSVPKDQAYDQSGSESEAAYCDQYTIFNVGCN